MGGNGAKKPLIAGNWKMNGLRASLEEIAAIAQGATPALTAKLDLLICPPATLLAQAVERAAGRLAMGGQDCHAQASGAFTGDVSAPMLADAGAKYVILGHSERRSLHGESNADVLAKALAARAAGLCPVICVGEVEGERRSGRALSVVASQLEGSLPVDGNPDNLAIAYEPVWAIGTGLTPTVANVEEMHAMIRGFLQRRYGEGGRGVRILYGGSVKPSNAGELMAAAHVNGALVGGASLKAADFLAIAAAV